MPGGHLPSPALLSEAAAVAWDLPIAACCCAANAATSPPSLPVGSLPHQVEDDRLSLAELLATRRGQLAVGADLAALAAMLPFLYSEACTALAYGPGSFLDLWKAVDLATYGLQVSIMTAGSRPAWHSPAGGAACMPGPVPARARACQGPCLSGPA